MNSCNPNLTALAQTVLVNSEQFSNGAACGRIVQLTLDSLSCDICAETGLSCTAFCVQIPPTVVGGECTDCQIGELLIPDYICPYILETHDSNYSGSGFGSINSSEYAECNSSSLRWSWGSGYYD